MRMFFTSAMLFFILSIFAQPMMKTFTIAPSSGTFIVPAGVTSIDVQAWGGGGAGGSARGVGFNAMGGGGGGGAFVSGTLSVTPGQMIAWSVGVATGANSGTGIIDGNSTTFGTIIALGGMGGQSVEALSAHVGGTGGAGGVGTFNGGAGGSRTGYMGTCCRGSAGGGGGAGNAGHGTAAALEDYTAGTGNVSHEGGAGGMLDGGKGGNGPTTSGAGGGQGVLGALGSGGGGAFAGGGNVLQNGGQGLRGEIRITYTVVLPIAVKSFDVSKIENTSVLQLTTTSETNNDYFTIERSGDGINFSNIGMIDGAGDSKTELSYTFTDTNPLSGINYYRIKQTDYDGKYSYTEIRSVRMDGAREIQITPRITDGRLTITTTLTDYTVTLINGAGQMVRRYTGLSFNDTISIDDLHTGIYYLRVESDTLSETIKVVKI
jgi:hypothetical protein